MTDSRRVKPKITAAICTLNGARRILAVLEAVAAQRDIGPDEWELLVIDNGSTDGTARVVSLFVSQHRLVNLRYLVENLPGQAAARRRAINEAQGEWICFVDDDNLLDPQYLSEALSFAARLPNLGAFGGRSAARTQVSPPSWFDPLKEGLAVWDGGEEDFRLGPGQRCFTAGLVVRTIAVRGIAGEPWVMTGRTADTPIGGEDLELCLKLEQQGWKRWYDHRLLFDHVLPEERLTLRYFRQLYATFGATHLLLYPVYFPLAGSRHLRFLSIAASALAHYPYCLLKYLLGKAPGRWLAAAKVWTYGGVIRYFWTGLGTLLRKT